MKYDNSEEITQLLALIKDIDRDLATSLLRVIVLKAEANQLSKDRDHVKEVFSA